MPLARIRTTLTSIPKELEEQLRASGYDVEFVRPDEQREQPAELELTLDSVEAGAALRLAAEGSGSVYVAAGALQTARKPTPDAGQREERQRAERAEVERLLAERRRAEEAGVAQQQAAAQAERREAQRREQERQEQLRQENGASDLQAAQLRRENELREQRRLVELRAAQQRKEQAQAEERKRLAEEQAQLRAEQERMRAELSRKEEELREHERRLRAEREQLEREREIARKEALLANQQSRAEKTEREDNEALPISAGAGARVELPAPLTSNVLRKPEVHAPEPHRRLQLRRVERPVFEGGSRRIRHREYRRAAAVAGVLTLVIMVLWIVLASRRPADPLTTPDLVRSNTVEQSSPFGAAKVPAPAQGQPQAGPQAPAQGPGKAAKPAAAKPNPAKQPRRTRTATADDDDEVVVRHFGAKSTNANESGGTTKDGVKVFSDLD